MGKKKVVAVEKTYWGKKRTIWWCLMFVLIFLYINLNDQIVNDFFCNYFRCLGAASTSPSKMALWSGKFFPTAFFFPDILFSWDSLSNYTDLLLRPIHFGSITQSILYIRDFLSLDLGKKMALYRLDKNVQRVLKTAPNGNLNMFAPQENYLSKLNNPTPKTLFVSMDIMLARMKTLLF